ncbi:MAG: hypothetical protein Q9218_002898 [Villophora microphyllina]
MSFASPGSWRILCTGLRVASKEPTGPPMSERTSIIHHVRSSQLRSFIPRSLSFSQYAIIRLPASIGKKHSCRTFSTIRRPSDAASGPSNSPRALPKTLRKSKVFSAAEIKSILGNKTSVTKGNQILHLVQEQRLAGTIDEAAFCSRVEKDRALAWLRKSYPVDEDKAILERIDREEQAALQPQAHREGQTSIYGNSVLDQIKKENIAKREQREREEKARKEAEAKEIPVSGTRAVAKTPSAGLVWAQKYAKKAEKSGLKEVPDMSFIQRVGPATLMIVTVLSLCVLFAQNHIPPSRAARLFSDVPTAAATVGALIGINVVVWLAWKIPPLWQPLNKWFLLTPAYPRIVSILGNNVSHQVGYHLGVNMVGLWFVGTSLHEDIGRGPFLAQGPMYLASPASRYGVPPTAVLTWRFHRVGTVWHEENFPMDQIGG